MEGRGRPEVAMSAVEPVRVAIDRGRWRRCQAALIRLWWGS